MVIAADNFDDGDVFTTWTVSSGNWTVASRVIVANAVPKKYALWSPTKGWLRGARWWRWTRFACFAAWHDRPSLLECLRRDFSKWRRIIPSDSRIIVMQDYGPVRQFASGPSGDKG